MCNVASVRETFGGVCFAIFLTNSQVAGKLRAYTNVHEAVATIRKGFWCTLPYITSLNTMYCGYFTILKSCCKQVSAQEFLNSGLTWTEIRYVHG